MVLRRGSVLNRQLVQSVTCFICVVDQRNNALRKKLVIKWMDECKNEASHSNTGRNNRTSKAWNGWRLGSIKLIISLNAARESV